MQRKFRGIPRFDGRFQSVSPDPQPQSANPAGGGGLPTEPPDTGGAPDSSSPSSQLSASSTVLVDLRELIQNLESLGIASESTRPNVPTLGEALRAYFGDSAQIDVDGRKIRVKTQQGTRQLEVYTRPSGGKTVAYLGLRDDKNKIRTIGQLLRYGNEYYIDAKLLENIDNKKPKRKLPKSVLYGAGLLAAGGAAVGLSRFLGGGEDDEDKKKGLQFEEVPLASQDGAPTTTAPAPTTTAPAPTTTAPAPTTTAPAPTSGRDGQPRVTVTERTSPSTVVREITSGEAPVQTQRKGNETVVKAGTSDGVFTLNIGADKTLILKDKEVVGEFPTSEIIRAVGQMADGKTEKEIRRSGEFDDLLKNPWFLVAIALALIAFTRRSGRE